MARTSNGWGPAEAADEQEAVANGDVAILERAAIRRLHARDMNVERSAVGVVRSGRATLAASSAGVVVARSVACDEARVGLLVAPVVRGEVHTLIDIRSAVAIGLGLALGRLLLAGGRALALALRP